MRVVLGVSLATLAKEESSAQYPRSPRVPLLNMHPPLPRVRFHRRTRLGPGQWLRLPRHLVGNQLYRKPRLNRQGHLARRRI